MDKSELFIKQCDCEEIQGQWLFPVGGDFFYVKEGYYSNGAEPSNGEYWVDKGEVGVLNGQDVILKNEQSEYVWLPMQHQVQSMIPGRSFLSPARLQDHFVKWIESENLYDFGRSMEQLWLYFYMDKKHSKTWDSKEERWVKL